MLPSRSAHWWESCIAPAGVRLAAGKQAGLQSLIEADQEQASLRATRDEAAELLTPSRGAGMQLNVGDRNVKCRAPSSALAIRRQLQSAT